MTENLKAWRQRGAWLIILMGGFGLRLYQLGAQSLWYDEAVSAYLASKSIPGLIAHTAGDIHPPGYYLLLHVWTRLAGDSEFALAFFSVIFGVLLIPLSYALARRLPLSRDRDGQASTIALWSALLVATSPYNLWYSQEARMYTLSAALGLVTLYCALANQRISELAKWRYPVGYVLAAAAGLYVLYYFGFLLVALNLFIIGHLLLNRRLLRLRTWLLAQAGVLILYLPWLPIAWRQATSPPVPPWRGLIPLQRVALEAWTALSLGQSVQPAQVWPIFLVTGILFLLGLWHVYANIKYPWPAVQGGQMTNNKSANQQTPAPQPLRAAWPQVRVSKSASSPSAISNLQSPISNLQSPISNPQSPLLLVTYTFGPLALIYLASLIVPLYHIRYLFTYAPAFYILLGAGLAWLTRRARPMAAAAALVLLAGSAFSIRELHTNPRYAADDFRAAVHFIAQRWRPGDAILINAGYAYTGFLYYYDDPIAGRVRLTDYYPAGKPASLASDGPLLLQSGSIGGAPHLGWGDPNSDFYATTQAETAAALARVTQAFPRVWMLRIYDTVTDPDGFIRDWLAANTTPFDDQLFRGEAFMRVQGFMSTNQPPPPSHVEVALEGGITLIGWQVKPSAMAGEPLDVVLWWRPDAPLATDYAVSLKLWEVEGEGPEARAHLAVQQDEWPLGSLLFTSAWPPGGVVRHPLRLWLPADLPPGQYRLNVEMYDPASVQPLARRDGRGDTISLGVVTVTSNQ